MVGHARKEIPLRLIALREGEVTRVSERLQEMAAGQVAELKALELAAVHEAGGGDASICRIAGDDRVLHFAIFSVDVAGAAPERVPAACFSSKFPRRGVCSAAGAPLCRGAPTQSWVRIPVTIYTKSTTREG